MLQQKELCEVASFLQASKRREKLQRFWQIFSRCGWSLGTKMLAFFFILQICASLGLISIRKDSEYLLFAIITTISFSFIYGILLVLIYPKTIICIAQEIDTKEKSGDLLSTFCGDVGYFGDYLSFQAKSWIQSKNPKEIYPIFWRELALCLGIVAVLFCIHLWENNFNDSLEQMIAKVKEEKNTLLAFKESESEKHESNKTPDKQIEKINRSTEKNLPSNQKAKQNQKQEGSQEQKQEGNQEQKQEGKQEQKQEGKQEQKQEGSQEQKQEGNQEQKQEGNQEQKQEGNQEQKQEGNQEQKQEGSQEQKQEGSQEQKQEGNQEQKQEGNQEQKQEGNQEQKQEGNQEQKQEGNQEQKQEGNQEQKQEGNQEQKQEGSQEQKQEGSQEQKQEGSQEQKQEGSQEQKQEGSQEQNQKNQQSKDQNKGTKENKEEKLPEKDSESEQEKQDSRLGNDGKETLPGGNKRNPQKRKTQVPPSLKSKNVSSLFSSQGNSDYRAVKVFTPSKNGEKLSTFMESYDKLVPKQIQQVESQPIPLEHQSAVKKYFQLIRPNPSHSE